jgi:hypothetical protein
MPKYSENTLNRLSDLRMGLRVDRPAAVTTGGTEALFHIYGGNVFVPYFYGEIMVAIDAACTLTITMNCDEAAGLDTALGSASADVNTYVAGRMIYLPAFGGAVTITGTCGAGPLNIQPHYILPPGTIDLASSGATTTGTIRWSMWYIPIDPAAYVTVG